MAVLTGGLHAQGTPVPWGIDAFGQVTDTPTGADFTQLAVEFKHSHGLRSDGVIVSWGSNDDNVIMGTPVGAGHTRVSASERGAVALRADGSIAEWGLIFEHPAPAGSGYVDLFSGHVNHFALRPDGSIAAWGYDLLGLVTKAPGDLGFTQVAAGTGHAVALRTDGSLFSWGQDTSGSVVDTPTGTGFVQVSAGYHFTLALRDDGTIVGWGNDEAGQLSEVPTGGGYIHVNAEAFGGMALTAAGTIVVWGGAPDALVLEIPGGAGYTSLAGGAGHAIAIRGEPSGVGFCFGDGTGPSCPCGNYGALGEGCQNSGSSGVQLTGGGVAKLSGDSLVLNVIGAPGATPGLVLRGDNQVAIPLGDGILCTTGNSKRSQIQITSAGVTSFSEFNGAPFSNVANLGAPTNFQFWYRDPLNTCSGAGFNFSNALSVVFQL